MSTTEPPRLQPLQAPYTPDVQASLAKWMPPGSDIEPLALFRTLMLHERLAGRMRPLGAGILGAGASVEPRLREVMIHRTCALTHAEYEWGVHAVAFGSPLGFSEAHLRSTVHGGHQDPCWGPPEALVFRLADELHGHSTISEKLWGQLVEQFEQEQILELIVTAGWYHVIAYVCNGAHVALEDWAMRFPSAS